MVDVFWGFFQVQKVSQFSGIDNQSYHNGITGPSGKVYVVRVGGYAAISSLYVARHILPDVLDSLAGTVGPWNTWKWVFHFTNANDLSKSIFHQQTRRRWKVVCLWFERLADWEGSGLTYTVASTGLQNTPRPLFSVIWKLVIFQKLWVSTQS